MNGTGIKMNKSFLILKVLCMLLMELLYKIGNDYQNINLTDVK